MQLTSLPTVKDGLRSILRSNKIYIGSENEKNLSNRAWFAESFLSFFSFRLLTEKKIWSTKKLCHYFIR